MTLSPHTRTYTYTHKKQLMVAVAAAVYAQVDAFLTIDEREELALVLPRTIHKGSVYRYKGLGMFELYGDQPLPLMERRVGEYRACAFPEQYLAPLRESTAYTVAHAEFDWFFLFYSTTLARCHPDEGMRHHARKVLDVQTNTDMPRNFVWSMIIEPRDEYMKVKCTLINGSAYDMHTVHCNSLASGELYARGFVELLPFMKFVEDAYPIIHLNIDERTNTNDAWVALMNRFYDTCIAQLPKQTFTAQVHFWNWSTNASMSIDDKLMELFPWCTIENLARVSKHRFRRSG